MKRALAVVFVLALLISALSGTLFIGNVTANPIMPDPETVLIKVQSPIKNKVYNTTEISLQFYATIQYSNAVLDDPWALGKVLSVQYWLDGKLVGQHEGEDLPKTYSAALTGLSDGKHSVKVWMRVHCFRIFRMWDERWGYRELYTLDEYLSGSEAISFTVETRPPRILVKIRETFEASSSTADVPLNFTVNKPASWVGYSLDGRNEVTVTHQVTLTKQFGVDNYRLVLSSVPAGSHNLTIYAKDMNGNIGESEQYRFTVAQETQPTVEPTQEPEPNGAFPTTLVAVAVTVIVAAVGMSFLVYFRKRTLRNKTPTMKAFVLIVLLLILGTTSSAQAQYTPVATIIGSHDQITDYFAIPTTEWRITWRCTPNQTFPYGLFAVSIYPKGESTALANKIAAMGENDTSGVLYIHEGEEDYYLKITAVHYEDYNITVEYSDTLTPSLSGTPTQPTTPFPTTLTAVAVAVIVTVVSFGLVAYFLRRKAKRGEA